MSKDELTIAPGSTVKDVCDYVLYHKYLSADVNYGDGSEALIMEADAALESMHEEDTAPTELVQRLIKVFGAEYGWA